MEGPEYLARVQSAGILLARHALLEAVERLLLLKLNCLLQVLFLYNGHGWPDGRLLVCIRFLTDNLELHFGWFADSRLLLLSRPLGELLTAIGVQLAHLDLVIFP